MAKLNKVCVNIDQTDPANGGFTNTEKAQARANIGAGTGNSAINRYDLSGTEYTVEQLNIFQRSINNAEIKDSLTSLGSTVPTPTLNSEEGKVPVAYYRDGRGYFILEKYKDSRFPDSDSTQVGQILTVDAHGVAEWATITPSQSVTPYFVKTSVTLAGGNMQFPTLIDIPNAVIPAGKTFVGTLTLCNYEASVVVMVGVFAGDLGGSQSSDVYEFFTGEELGGVRRNTFSLPVKQTNSTNADILLKMGLNGSVSAQSLGLTIQGILY